MPRDYARRSKRRPVRQQWRRPLAPKISIQRRSPWIALLFLIILLPIFIFSLTVIKKHPLEKSNFLKTVKDPLAKEAEPINLSYKPNSKPNDKIHFEFYTLLPKESVDTSEIKQVSSTPLQKSHEIYIIQIASFLRKKDAKDLQIDLKLRGFNPIISTIKRGRTKWYRVQIGPFTNKTKIDKIHDKLQKQGTYSLIVATH